MPISKIGHYSMENPGSVYDEEALTALELAGRTAKKVNECVTEVNDIPKKVSTAIKNHIDNGDFAEQIDQYAGALSIQIENAIEYNFEMVETKTYELEGRVNNLLGKVVQGSTSMDSEIIDARWGWDRVAYGTIGEAIRGLTFRHHRSLVDVDLNYVVEPDCYTVSISANNPLGDKGTILHVISSGHQGRWITQVVRNHEENCKTVMIRFGDHKNYQEVNTNRAEAMNIEWGEWMPLIAERTNIKTAGVNINEIVDAGQYVIQVTDSVNGPDGLNTGYMLDVIDFQPWVIQYAYTINDFNVWCRRVRYDGSEDPSAWEKVIGKVDITKPNAGQNIVVFGDSIIDFTKDGTDIVDFIADLTGATVYNAGFNGCRMSTHSSASYAPYSMCELADAVATGNFAPQTDAGTFVKRVNILKDIDFSEVNTIVIAFGTNDFTGEAKLDNTTGDLDKTTFGGSTRYAIETILTAHPHIRIVLSAPTWRYWMNADGTYKDDGDTRTNNRGNKLHEFVDKLIEIGNTYHIPVINPYDNMGINKFNYSQWFRPNDGTHPSSAGQYMLAKQISGVLSTM